MTKKLSVNSYAERRKAGMLMVADELLNRAHSVHSMAATLKLGVTACRTFLVLMEEKGYAVSRPGKATAANGRQPRIFKAVGPDEIEEFKANVLNNEYPTKYAKLAHKEPDAPIDGYNELFHLFFIHILGKPKETLL